MSTQTLLPTKSMLIIGYIRSIPKFSTTQRIKIPREVVEIIINFSKLLTFSTGNGNGLLLKYTNNNESIQGLHNNNDTCIKLFLYSVQQYPITTGIHLWSIKINNTTKDTNHLLHTKIGITSTQKQHGNPYIIETHGNINKIRQFIREYKRIKSLIFTPYSEDYSTFNLPCDVDNELENCLITLNYLKPENERDTIYLHTIDQLKILKGRCLFLWIRYYCSKLIDLRIPTPAFIKSEPYYMFYFRGIMQRFMLKENRIKRDIGVKARYKQRLQSVEYIETYSVVYEKFDSFVEIARYPKCNNIGGRNERNGRWHGKDMVVTMVLDCNLWMVSYYINGEHVKCEGIEREKGYWFGVETCDSVENKLSVITNPCLIELGYHEMMRNVL